MADLNQFVAWVQLKPDSRICKIEIEKVRFWDKDEPLKIQAWVFDRDIGASQYVSSVNEINLEAVSEKEERDRYEKLKAKFEGKK